MPALADQDWTGNWVKDGEKGPLVWDVKHTRVTMKNDDGLPGIELHLVVARNALDHGEVKFFVANAPPETSVLTLLLVAFSRWRVERCFRVQKQEIGLDQWEGRHYVGLKRLLILSCVSSLFLARCRERLRGKNPEVTICQVHAVGALVESWWLQGRASPTLIEHTAQIIQHWQQRNAAARTSHRRRTFKKLRENHIVLKELIRCQWP